MKKFVREVLELVRPFGLRKLVFVCALMLIQAVIQLLSIFSLLPFLSAASDMVTFRASRGGAIFIKLVGGGSDSHILVLAGLVALTILIVSNVSTVVVEYVRGRYSYQLGHWLHVKMFRLLLERRYEYFLNINSSVLLKNMIDDIGHFSQQVVLTSLDVAARTMLSLLLGISVLVIEPTVFLIAAGTIALYIVAVILPIRRRASRTSALVQTKMRRLYFEVYQNISAVKPILATEQRSYFIRRSENASATVAEELPRIPLYGQIPRSVLEILVFGGLIVWVLMTILSGGDLVTLMPRVGLIAIIAYRLMPSLQLIFSQAMQIAANRQAMEEIQQIFDEQTEMSAVAQDRAAGDMVVLPRSWSTSIRFDHLSFSYKNADRPALSDIDLTIRKGEHVAFVGSTGSGKSTLVDLILGLLQPSSGQILVDDVPLTAADMPAWRKTLGYVPQDLFLLDASVAENIAFGMTSEQLDLDRVREVARRAHADSFIETGTRHGYASMVGERGTQLSGGQRQRLAVARALYSDPSVLVMDEATSALDPNTEEAVLAGLIDSEKAKTIITVTHRLATVKNCDRIYFMQNGRIVASGTYAELTERDEAFRSFSQ